MLGLASATLTVLDDEVAPTHTVSGAVTDAGSGAPLAGVAFAASGDAGASCTDSDAGGAYTCTVPEQWSGTVTPSVGWR